MASDPSSPRQNFPRIGEERAPGFGHLHPARFATQKLGVQFSFQGLDLLTERRLLNTQAFGGAGDVPFLGDGDEIAEMAEVHVGKFTYIFNSYE